MAIHQPGARLFHVSFNIQGRGNMGKLLVSHVRKSILSCLLIVLRKREKQFGQVVT